MKKKITATLLLLTLNILVAVQANAQCAMCSINAEQGVKNGNTVSAGLNTGVLYLLAIPYLAVMIVGIIWYKKYRKRNAEVILSK
ncbi:hypothetical protein [Pedobacter sp. MW01-1-1]|uniref:hypothetical protein n=1 Tax=Pedobacter sp. MW01-1-1 TaxID=3383027 RepID=UPI003FED7DFD